MIYQILLDKRLGGFSLPESTYILAAGNRVVDGASAYEMDTATADRLTHLEITPAPAQWLNWAQKADIHPFVLTFIKTRPDMLFDNSLDDIVRSSPRSWEKVSDLLKINDNPTEMGVLIAGRVGTRTAAIFVQTMQELSELPDIPSLFKILGNSNHEVELQRLAPSTLAGYYGLAYGLNALASSSKKLTQAMYIFKTMTLVRSGLPEKEILTMGLRVFHDTLYQKNWSLKVFSDELYTSHIVDVIMSIPDLNDIAAQYS